MKNYKIILLVFIMPVFLSSAVEQSKKPTKAIKGKWSGKVSFYETLTGGSVTYEWRMDAVITDDTGTVVHSYNSLSKEGCTQDCSTAGPTELELGIDIDTKEYGIRVPVQGCSGISVCKGNSNKFALTDETAILIEGQPLKSEYSVSGTTSQTYSANGSTTITKYSWSLTKN
jgi:hypothetical protein